MSTTIGAYALKIIIFSTVNMPMASQDTTYFATKQLCMDAAKAIVVTPDETGSNGYIREAGNMKLVATCHETGL